MQKRYTKNIKLEKIKTGILALQGASLNKTGRKGTQDEQLRHEANMWIWRSTNQVATFFLSLPVVTPVLKSVPPTTIVTVVDGDMMWRLSLVVEEWMFLWSEELLDMLELRDRQFVKEIWENENKTVAEGVAKPLLPRAEALKKYMEWFRNNETNVAIGPWDEERYD